MLDHLKNFSVGLAALALLVAGAFAVEWLSTHYANEIFNAIGVLALVGAAYGLGWSIRSHYSLVRDGDSGEGE